MLRFLSKSLVGIATETKETERRFIARWAGHCDEIRYFRFSVDQGLQDVGLVECRERGRIEAVRDEYLRHQARKFRVRDCVHNQHNHSSPPSYGSLESMPPALITISRKQSHTYSLSSRWRVPSILSSSVPKTLAVDLGLWISKSHVIDPRSEMRIHLFNLVPSDAEIMMSCAQGDLGRVRTMLESGIAHLLDIYIENPISVMGKTIHGVPEFIFQC